jgi:hypothetical protein
MTPSLLPDEPIRVSVNNGSSILVLNRSPETVARSPNTDASPPSMPANFRSAPQPVIRLEGRTPTS